MIYVLRVYFNLLLFACHDHALLKAVIVIRDILWVESVVVLIFLSNYYSQYHDRADDSKNREHSETNVAHNHLVSSEVSF